ncbi:hypothetical protein S7335_629 [Synechococcus sp. PCC 7335]|uniref:hypothetical protein n=1 Tax=Synechococcus sp. (strain ATCC 29403 / PCC 7335) TaxID=91464 RepID=UPI00017EBCB2|nr:hypothetical protein [Synechococcus sp. PCC 7335]EDX83310.1 hypothetical protein S7335_490 [Synechococcus sp. PCC 7335]EDX83449.1 hypothetical protein S7335_629 [Synechococcus sp. PCC 7335]
MDARAVAVAVRSPNSHFQLRDRITTLYSFPLHPPLKSDMESISLTELIERNRDFAIEDLLMDRPVLLSKQESEPEFTGL